MNAVELFNKEEIESELEKIAQKIIAENDLKKLAIIGIQTRGVTLAQRLVEKIKNKSTVEVSFGSVDVTFHRDDLNARGTLPVVKETKIDFGLEDKNVLLVDDVIYTGRSTKAALDTLMDFGRPQAIKLCALIDRGGRELPIQPDYLGFSIQSNKDSQVFVKLLENDNEEKVIIEK